MISHANKQRYTITSEKAEDEAINITDRWKKEIDSMPFISKHKGKMSSLLKKKSKVLTIKKERKTFKAFDFKKRLRSVDDAKS